MSGNGNKGEGRPVDIMHQPSQQVPPPAPRLSDDLDLEDDDDDSPDYFVAPRRQHRSAPTTLGLRTTSPERDVGDDGAQRLDSVPQRTESGDISPIIELSEDEEAYFSDQIAQAESRSGSTDSSSAGREGLSFYEDDASAFRGAFGSPGDLPPLEFYSRQLGHLEEVEDDDDGSTTPRARSPERPSEGSMVSGVGTGMDEFAGEIPIVLDIGDLGITDEELTFFDDLHQADLESPTQQEFVRTKRNDSEAKPTSAPMERERSGSRPSSTPMKREGSGHRAPSVSKKREKSGSKFTTVPIRGEERDPLQEAVERWRKEKDRTASKELMAWKERALARRKERAEAGTKDVQAEPPPPPPPEDPKALSDQLAACKEEREQLMQSLEYWVRQQNGAKINEKTEKLEGLSTAIRDLKKRERLAFVQLESRVTAVLERGAAQQLNADLKDVLQIADTESIALPMAQFMRGFREDLKRVISNVIQYQAVISRHSVAFQDATLSGSWEMLKEAEANMEKADNRLRALYVELVRLKRSHREKAKVKLDVAKSRLLANLKLRTTNLPPAPPLPKSHFSADSDSNSSSAPSSAKTAFRASRGASREASKSPQPSQTASPRPGSAERRSSPGEAVAGHSSRSRERPAPSGDREQSGDRKPRPAAADPSARPSSGSRPGSSGSKSGSKNPPKKR